MIRGDIYKYSTFDHEEIFVLRRMPSQDIRVVPAPFRQFLWGKEGYSREWHRCLGIDFEWIREGILWGGQPEGTA